MKRRTFLQRVVGVLAMPCLPVDAVDNIVCNGGVDYDELLLPADGARSMCVVPTGYQTIEITVNQEPAGTIMEHLLPNLTQA